MARVGGATGCYARGARQHIVTNFESGGSPPLSKLSTIRMSMRLARAILLGLAAALAAAPAFAQQDRDWRHGKGHPGQFQRQMPPPGYGGRMDREERRRMRDDLHSTNRDFQRERPARRLSPEEREQLRRDIQEANRNLERR
ncbi:MAG: hypothetical protein ACREUO_12130 [Burkholderiales bacterium]